jgi:hypothetical protein
VLVRSASEFGDALSRHSLLRHGGILSTRSSTIKIGKIAVAATLVALTHGQLAFAAPRTVEETPTVDLPAGLGCPSFPLRIEGTDAMVRVVTFEDQNGGSVRTITVRTGVVLTYTNLTTGETISFKTSGSVTRTATANGVDTVTATGHNGLILFPTDIPAGPTATQYTGKIVYTVDQASGLFTLVSASGKRTDICAALS